MGNEQFRILIDELDSFVEDDLPYDHLTEFVAELALRVREATEVDVLDVARSVMDEFRTERGDDSVRAAMRNGAVRD